MYSMSGWFSVSYFFLLFTLLLIIVLLVMQSRKGLLYLHHLVSPGTTTACTSLSPERVSISSFFLSSGWLPSFSLTWTLNLWAKCVHLHSGCERETCCRSCTVVVCCGRRAGGGCCWLLPFQVRRMGRKSSWREKREERKNSWWFWFLVHESWEEQLRRRV